MKTDENIGLSDVNAVYDGPEGNLWELLMGHQIHIGGFKASMDLAERAGIGAGQRGVDLCCCSGAGMRFLVRFRDVASMVGVDATQMNGATAYKLVVASNADESLLYKSTQEDVDGADSATPRPAGEMSQMPQAVVSGDFDVALDDDKATLLKDWIADGAEDN